MYKHECRGEIQSGSFVNIYQIFHAKYGDGMVRQI